jgi:hypothetical protein
MQNIDKIAEICSAFEMGKYASSLGLSTIYNEFADESDAYYAWMIGHTVGLQREFEDVEETFRLN